MNYLNTDETIQYVMNIVDNIKCDRCDKTDGQRMRYSCGHAACEDCVIDAEDCQICLTPPQTSSPPKPDDALTLRVKNASVLQKNCQDLFNTDVFKRKRLTEQLRIEKELFPKCIQAPVKYENKRKSNNYSYKNKENRNSSFFPGEETSSLKENITMENSVSYVQQWLNKNDKDFSRKPFRDLNVNTQLDNKFKLQINNNKLQTKIDENVPLLKRNKKRSHFKTTVKNCSPLGVNRKSFISKCNSNSKRVKNELHQFYEDDVLNETWKECDNDESGIFMDNDPIVIDDSQETVTDKDKNAWLAVLEANKHEKIESTSVANLNCSDAKNLSITSKQTPTRSDGLQSKINQNTKVPFYKKCYITETCTYCNVANKAVGQSKEVKITIDNDNFTTIIKILNNVKDSSKLNTTNSVSAQTDICEPIPMDHEIGVKDSDDIVFTNFNEQDCRGDVTSLKSDTQSEDLFADEGKNIANEYERIKIPNCLVIEESDSDVDMDESGPLPVKVDVHRSCNESEYGILGEIFNIQQHDSRPRRGPRGLTPTSTNSSEKENFNPNRKIKHTKKKKYAKK